MQSEVLVLHCSDLGTDGFGELDSLKACNPGNLVLGVCPENGVISVLVVTLVRIEIVSIEVENFVHQLELGVISLVT